MPERGPFPSRSGQESLLIFMRHFHAALRATFLISLSLGTASEANAQEAPKESSVLTKAPELIRFVEAPYPESEAQDPRAAEVVLSILISEEGVVTEAEVVDSAGPAFDEAALLAVRGFVFSPAEIAGKPAPVKVTYRYAFAKPEPVVTTAVLTGVLRDRESGEPVAGATVRVAGLLGVVTDKEGRFTVVDVPAGKATVEVLVPGLSPLLVTEELAAGETVETLYEVVFPEEEAPTEPVDDFEVVVLAPPQLERKVVSTSVQADQARKLPGTQGDVLKVVESMPGVARASAGSGDVVVWGAAPGDTRTYVGAVRIPALYHFGGLRSVVHGDLVSDVELTPGGYGAAHGRGLGGLILIETAAPKTDGWHGSVQADVLDGSVAVTGPVGGGTSVALAARKSYIAELGTLVTDDSFGQYFSIPEYYDGAARVRKQLSPGSWIEFGGLVSGDVQERNQPSENPAFRSSERRTLGFQRLDVRFESETGDGEKVVIAPWYGHDARGRSATYPELTEVARTTSHLGGLRIDYRRFLSKNITSRTGVDAEFVASESRRKGSLTTPPREGDPYVFGRAPASQQAFDSWDSTVVSVAPYAELDLGLLQDRLHVVPGIRIEPYVQTVSRSRPAQDNNPDLATLTEDVSVEPRLMIDYRPVEVLSLKGGGGLYRQPPPADDLSAVFGNPQLTVARGAHLLFGAGLQVVKSVRVEATVFRTTSTDLGSRNPSTAPRVSEALVQSGYGRTLGAQFLVRKEKLESPLYGWVAYTVSRSERRATKNGEWRLFDLDQTHVLTAVASYELGGGFEFGVRARVASGFPRTPVVGAYYDTSRGRYEPLLGELNTIRIPTFYQFDARVSKSFALPTSDLEIYLDVQNVTNSKNAEEIAYAPDYSEERFVLGLPILPVLGARLEF